MGAQFWIFALVILPGIAAFTVVMMRRRGTGQLPNTSA